MQIRPTCCNIGCNRPCHAASKVGGRIKYRPYCVRCHEANMGKKTYVEGVTPIKKNYCENEDGRLGFVCYSGGKSMPSCMLDLDHISGHKEDNSPKNIQTLCRCCHAMKGKMNGDFKDQKKYKESK